MERKVSNLPHYFRFWRVVNLWYNIKIKRFCTLSLGCFENPNMYWLDSLGWIMVKFMYVQMTNVIFLIDSIIN